MIVYIVGPYRALNINDVFVNIAVARAASVDVWQAGHTPLCPHLNSGLMDGVVDDEVFLDGDLKLLEAVATSGGCLVLVGDWESSEGARLELQKALDLEMPIFSLAHFLKTNHKHLSRLRRDSSFQRQHSDDNGYHKDMILRQVRDILAKEK